MSDQNTYTLVTGASNGIGKAIAENCAARGQNVLLVALPEPKLEEVAAALKEQYPTQSFDALGTDMMQKESPQEIYDWCKQNGYIVDILVNNAGLGNSGAFLSREASFYYGQMQLNMVSLVMLTHLFLEDMKRLPKTYVLNVASMASFYDIPYKGIYSASKRFVHSFSRSLRKELEATNIGVTILCPAAVLTNPDVIQRDKEMGKASKMTQQTPEEVAEYALARMYQGKAIAIPGFMPKVYKALGRIIPYSIQMRMLANAFIKQSK
ncbi:SDR family oxidoreductase [Roseivirga sp. E12]|uniref:SDR family NAD(P)-dependent oxidoreductase n=1 Tax=Roseivirga sp. E12 TaxID=2819237 RepID=UPI001ABC727C|nr:SDR family NAD(P)-dependent oxidoreductase [Roseivirga sp. E12]MBO3698984.1 SDR family NAD(P)-dependent oxidoreductase [Roseivirga sp. E12]